MKKLYAFFAFFLITLTFAQAPQGFNYQATVRNNTGALIINQNVNFKFNLMQNSPTAVPVYSETHYVPTDDLGAVNLVIGKGTATTGILSDIDWGNGNYYLGIELNTGSGYVAMGTTQLLSVPYALYAQSSGTNALIGSISNTSNPNGGTITSGVLNLSPADATNGGVITTGEQTIAGVKTFSADLNVNGITFGRGSGDQEYNNAVGIGALEANTTGQWNVGLGYWALKSNTTGGSNNAIGLRALTANTTGSENNAIGDSALYKNTIGSQNIANGVVALGANTTGSSNVAIGAIALFKNTTGNDNTAIGYHSLNGNINGNGNTAVGYNANTSGDLTNATAIGNSAIVATSNTIQLGNRAVTSVNTSGEYKGAAFVKTGGTSSQYLMADGSVSSGTTIAALQSQVTALENILIKNGLYDVTDIDGNVYDVVKIGNQIWTKENLNVTKYSDGTLIPQVSDPTAWANLTTGAWCYYNNDSANGTIYGKLYNWYAIAGIYDTASLNTPSLRKQFAPTGWHVPSDIEWTILSDYLGGENVAGGKMKATILWDSPNLGASNSSGFASLPGGVRYSDGIYQFQGYSSNFWTSTLNNTTIFFRNNVSVNEILYRGTDMNLNTGISIRCVKD